MQPSWPRPQRWSRSRHAAVVTTVPTGGRAALKWFIAKQPGGALEKIAQRCSERSDGRYKIEFELLPAQADAQREQLVRRLGAEDETIDLMGMDVVWTGEFANAGWLAQCTAVDTAGGHARRVRQRAGDGALRGQALRRPDLVQHPAALVPQGPRRVGAQDVGRDDRRRPRRSAPGKGRIQVQANRYEGLVVWANQLIESAGGVDPREPGEGRRSAGADQAARWRSWDACRARRSPTRRSRPRTRDRPHSASSDGDSAFMINYPFVYPSAKANAPDVFKQIAAAPVPGGRSRASRAPRRSAGSTSASRRSRSTRGRRVRRRRRASSASRTRSRSRSSRGCRRCGRICSTTRSPRRPIPGSPR